MTEISADPRDKKNDEEDEKKPLDTGEEYQENLQDYFSRTVDEEEEEEP